MKKELVGCFDAPDRRDWIPERMFGGNIPDDRYSDLINMVNIRARDQKGINNCTSQAITNIIMIMIRIGQIDDPEDNMIENIDGDPYKLWERQHIKVDGTWGTAALKGDYLQNSLKTAKALGVPILIGNKWINVKIKAYSRITDDEVDTYLRKGHPIFTGFDWIIHNGSAYDGAGIIWEDGVEKVVGGHAISIPIRKMTYGLFNSHGERWGKFKNGTAGVTGEKLKTSYSKYIITLDFDQIREDLAN